MQVNIYEDYETLSNHAAREIVRLIKEKDDAVLCLAAGNTPQRTYELLSQMVMTEKVDVSRCTFVGLDEWLGIPPENEGSCHYFLQQFVFKPLNILSGRIHLFDALSGDPELECKKMNEIVSRKGAIDLMMVGIGMNGHIGFNEPGRSFSRYAHVVDLDENTKAVGQKYFKEHTLLTKGITLGLQHLLEARKAILIANGINKASIIKKALEENITPQVPASIMQKHGNGVVMIDEEAASGMIR